MDKVDGSDHYQRESTEPPPALLTIIIDTNPSAWSTLSDTLPLSKALANLLVFINAHLAFNHANQVAVIASHSNRAQWLYPSPAGHGGMVGSEQATTTDGDVEMADSVDGVPQDGLRSNATRDAHRKSNGGFQGTKQRTKTKANDANKYRPFHLVEDEVTANVSSLLSSVTEDDMVHADSTMMAGALSLALAYINKQTLAYSESNGGAGVSSTGTGEGAASRDAEDGKLGLQSRILVVSVSSDTALQYIPVMNCIFAAQRKRIPIDVLKLASATAFLQQAADATRGIYMRLGSPLGLLQYLMMAFLPDQTARRQLVLPTQVDVDFRAACFCHKKVVDVGFVCSICLSIFCEPPPGADCLTCGTHLQLGDYGAKPAVVPRKKKKRKRAVTRGDTPNARTDSPAPE